MHVIVRLEKRKDPLVHALIPAPPPPPPQYTMLGWSLCNARTLG